MLSLYSDEYFMKEALKEAKVAFQKEEVPVGAVIVYNKTVIARAHNLTETLTDVTAHAEMQAFTAAANTLGNKFLQECALYVTLEPCSMCAGASYWTQLGKIVFGASDAKRGYQKVSPMSLHPKTEVLSGVMDKECGDLLKLFFESRR